MFHKPDVLIITCTRCSTCRSAHLYKSEGYALNMSVFEDYESSTV